VGHGGAFDMGGHAWQCAALDFWHPLAAATMALRAGRPFQR